jgi:hypothetical protein
MLFHHGLSPNNPVIPPWSISQYDYWEIDHGGITGLLGDRPWWNNMIIGS